MTEPHAQGAGPAAPADALERATEWFIRLRGENAGPEDLALLQHWLEEHPSHRAAYTRVSASWSVMGQYACAREIMKGRRDALEDARRAAGARVPGPRWLRLAVAAGCCAMVMALGLTVWSQAYAGVYATGMGERRSLTLADGSVVTLDARSRVRVKYRHSQRLICLEQGQARFDVAKNPAVPFLVKAGHETIFVRGTQFNVELVARTVLVTMIAGHGEVRPDEGRPDVSPQIDLKSGEALHVGQDGRAVRLAGVDVARVTAWQSGRLFFDNEPLASAAERLNRYASQQIQVDPSAADMRISGVFNVGDAHAFVEAVMAYFPVRAEEVSDRTVRLMARN